MTTSSYDDAVIGSSPLMLMQAIRAARAGRRVVLLDRVEHLGGSWRKATLADGSLVETACHLIEPFPGVYEALESHSGMAFGELDVPPVRVDVKGRIAEYVSPRMLALSIVRMLLTIGTERTRRLLGRSSDVVRLDTAEWKLASLLRYQRRYLLQRPDVHGPTMGYVGLIDGLGAEADRAGVETRIGAVVALRRAGPMWWLELETTPADCQRIQAERVFTTSNAGLVRENDALLVAEPATPASRSAVVVDIESGCVATAQTYVAYWRDPAFIRASRIDDGRHAPPVRRYLLELRRDVDPAHDQIRTSLERACILRPGAPFSFVGRVDYELADGQTQMNDGELAPNVFCLRSSGNLAAGVARWLATPKHSGAG